MNIPDTMASRTILSWSITFLTSVLKAADLFVGFLPTTWQWGLLLFVLCSRCNFLSILYLLPAKIFWRPLKRKKEFLSVHRMYFPALIFDLSKTKTKKWFLSSGFLKALSQPLCDILQKKGSLPPDYSRTSPFPESLLPEPMLDRSTGCYLQEQVGGARDMGLVKEASMRRQAMPANDQPTGGDSLISEPINQEVVHPLQLSVPAGTIPPDIRSSPALKPAPAHQGVLQDLFYDPVIVPPKVPPQPNLSTKPACVEYETYDFSGDFAGFQNNLPRPSTLSTTTGFNDFNGPPGPSTLPTTTAPSTIPSVPETRVIPPTPMFQINPAFDTD
ncbi:uncharacterized protein HD556DRAFT_1442779 [Suillus plorans]|uniref:Uncharacterized protein n=1 Tax=Suillus plorans TaxID=116603 RepID=A0A9P7AS69_9AGAM|nr:uncharacterized protein HD556DRAFT_1442779 [Suillus plorans]KAG1794595.1 hypothetical protein HD556DRAFT_1442779 [Suillus plorans]